MFYKDKNGKWGVNYDRLIYVEEDHICYFDKDNNIKKTGYIDPKICDKVAIRWDMRIEFDPLREVVQSMKDNGL